MRLARSAKTPPLESIRPGFWRCISMIKSLGRLLLLALPLAIMPLHAQVLWVRHAGSDSPIPSHVVVAARKHGGALYVCRARLADGVHSGESAGSMCIVPFKGDAQVFEDFEFATASHYSWGRDRWNDGVIAGRQSGKVDLFVCRARVVQGSVDNGFVPGKAYERGLHADHCYVPFHGKELDFVHDFELLHASSSTRSQRTR